LRGEKARSHFGRALRELGIEWIAAHSPQAKGRIERLFETLQDRLVKEMRLAGIDSLAAANHFLQMRFLPAWEERFTVAPRRPRNVGSSFATNLVRGLLAPFEGTLIRDPKGNFLTTVKK